MSRFKIFCIALLGGYFSTVGLLKAQNYYGYSSSGALVIFNPQTCEVCDQVQLNGIAPANANANGDIFVTNDGNVVLTLGNQILVYDPPNPNPITNLTVPGITQFAGSAAGPGNSIYIVGTVNNNANLYTFDLSTNALTLIGPFNQSITTFTDLYYMGGQLYGIVPSGGIFNINVNNPSASTQTNYSYTNGPAMTDGGFNIIFGIFSQFNISNGQSTFICNLPPGANTVKEIYQIPASVNPQPSCSSGGCISNAGTLANTSLTICIPGSANIPFNNNATLDANDLLQYIIASNPSDPGGSLLSVTSANPIAFDPALFLPGVTYYLGTVVGDNSGGSVNLSDPCLDFSNLVPVIWHPKPSLTLSSAESSVCESGCGTLILNLNGTPPFLLQGQVLLNGTLLSTQNNFFSSTTGTLQICAPSGAAGSNVSFQATQLTDANCTCN